jgi:hypothetical protein
LPSSQRGDLPASSLKRAVLFFTNANRCAGKLPRIIKIGNHPNARKRGCGCDEREKFHLSSSLKRIITVIEAVACPGLNMIAAWKLFSIT